MKKYARKDANMSAGRLQANTTARANGLSDDRRAAIGAATLASTATIKAVTQTTLRAMPQSLLPGPVTASVVITNAPQAMDATASPTAHDFRELLTTPLYGRLRLCGVPVRSAKGGAIPQGGDSRALGVTHGTRRS